MRKLIVITLILSIIISFFVISARHKSNTFASNKLRQIGVSLENYYSTHNRFPPVHLDGHSWRIRIHPFLISSALYMNYDFDVQWNDVNNLTLHERPVRSGKGPNPDALVICGKPSMFHENEQLVDQTSFLLIAGDEAFGSESGRQLNEIEDSLETTIVAAETNRRDIHWLRPFDFQFDKMSFRINDGADSISSNNPRGPLVLFADGEVFRVNPDIDSMTLRAMLTISGHEQISRSELVESGLLIAP